MRQVTKENGRYLWADIIRTVAIFLVVFVHNLFFLPQNTLGTLWMWIPYLYAHLGIPLFVMISGALLLGRSEPLSFFFRKRIRAVLFPWIFWIAIYIVVDYFFYLNRPASSAQWIRYIYEMFFSRFWFLPMIFGLYLLTPILRTLLRGASRTLLLYALSLWYFAFALLPGVYKAFGIYSSLDSSLLRQIMQYSGLFVLGYVLSQKHFFQRPLRFWVVLLLASIGATYITVFLTSFSLSEQLTDPFFYRIFSPTMVPGIIAGFMILFLLSNRWDETVSQTTRSVLAAMSVAALGIYLVHELVQEGIARFFPGIDVFLHTLSPLLAAPLRAVIVFLLSFTIIFLIRRIPLIKLFA
ncbi:MAG: acyltransferase family protein [Candidatus Levybacteria bacterium]|nr:acyltransferase family protein [Candidatus Levybacteria bacterium]